METIRKTLQATKAAEEARRTERARRLRERWERLDEAERENFRRQFERVAFGEEEPSSAA